jgi:hypothetical protein
MGQTLSEPVVEKVRFLLKRCHVIPLGCAAVPTPIQLSARVALWR